MKRNIVVAMTGASGAAYGIRLIETLSAAGCDIHLSISEAASLVLKRELGLTVDLNNFDRSMLMLDEGGGLRDRKPRSPRTALGANLAANGGPETAAVSPGEIHYCHWRDFLAPIASGSFHTDGMAVCPCSSGTLGAIVHGASANLIHRAAEVHLKERRRLVLTPRETPLSLVQLENMRRAAELGAVVLPAMPGFYHGAKTIGDLVDFIVSRICDQLDVPNALIDRWGE